MQSDWPMRNRINQQFNESKATSQETNAMTLHSPTPSQLSDIDHPVKIAAA